MSSFHSEIRTSLFRRFISRLTPEGRARVAAEKQYIKILAEVKEMLTKAKPVTLMDSAMLPMPAIAPLGSSLDVTDLIRAQVKPAIAKPSFVFRSGEAASAGSNPVILGSLRSTAFDLIKNAGLSEISAKMESAKYGNTIIAPRTRAGYLNKWKIVLDAQIAKIKNAKGVTKEDKIRLIEEIITEILTNREYHFLEKDEKKAVVDEKKKELEAYKNDPKQV